MTKFNFFVLITFILHGSSAFSTECTNITELEIHSAQKKWGDGILGIRAAQDQKAEALNHLNSLYAYDKGKVLFKPTLASQHQFRSTKEDALSYFIAGKFKEDLGFAINPFTKIEFQNDGIIIDCDSAFAMGNYYFTKPDSEILKAEYSFGYIKDESGNLLINIHHSSLPYSAN